MPSPGTIDITAMLDRDHPHYDSALVNLVDDAKFPPSSDIPAEVFIAKRSADAIRTLREVTANKVPARHSNGLR
jgi:hypothetical protein